MQGQGDLGVNVYMSQMVAEHIEGMAGKADVILDFINRGIEHKSRNIMLTIFKVLFQATNGVLLRVLVTTNSKGCDGTWEGAEKNYMNDSKNRGSQLKGQVGEAGFFLFGQR